MYDSFARRSHNRPLTFHFTDVLHALNIPVTPFLSRLIAVLVLTVALLLHGTHLRNIGLRVQNALGVFTLATLSFIALVGVASALKGIWVPGGGTDGDDGVVVGGGKVVAIFVGGDET